MNMEEIQQTTSFIEYVQYIRQCLTIVSPNNRINSDIYPFYINGQGYFLAQYNQTQIVSKSLEISFINDLNTRNESHLLTGPTQTIEIALLYYFEKLLPMMDNFDSFFSYKTIASLCTKKERGDLPETQKYIAY